MGVLLRTKVGVLRTWGLEDHAQAHGHVGMLACWLAVAPMVRSAPPILDLSDSDEVEEAMASGEE